ncbi:unnamed protein product [Prorocentrum cordatum]|uniref:Uncharacterized protein n=1 Tax=Prorocentrum cordatum TaxID=2364126 RepID=A0ABN9QCG7_9DINO|nr:unnamed protein product [Polarella glacialis]
MGCRLTLGPRIAVDPAVEPDSVIRPDSPLPDMIAPRRRPCLLQRIAAGFAVHDVRELNRGGIAIGLLLIVRAARREFSTQMKTRSIQNAMSGGGHIWADLCGVQVQHVLHQQSELQTASIFT